jgi:hypothetical protein
MIQEKYKYDMMTWRTAFTVFWLYLQPFNTHMELAETRTHSPPHTTTHTHSTHTHTHGHTHSKHTCNPIYNKNNEKAKQETQKSVFQTFLKLAKDSVF